MDYQQLIEQLNQTLTGVGGNMYQPPVMPSQQQSAISPYSFSDWLGTQGDFNYDPQNFSINGVQLGQQAFQSLSQTGFGTYDSYQNILGQYNQLSGQMQEYTTPQLQEGEIPEEGQYISPYQQQINQIMQQLQQMTPYQTPPELEQYLMSLLTAAQSPFTYDPTQDQALINAQEKVGKDIREGMGEKNLLYSSATLTNMAQAQGSLVPEYEMRAYQRHADQRNREIQMATVLMQWDAMQADRWADQLNLVVTKFNYIMQLDEMNFQTFQVLLDQRNWEKQYALQQEQLSLERQQWEIENAYARVDALGYVDNATSTILGLPVGTKAQWVLELEKQQKMQMDLLKKEHEYQISLQKKQAAIEKELVKYKAKLDEAAAKKLQSEQYKLDKQLLEYQHKLAMGGSTGGSASAVASARSLLGVKYVYGGTSTTKGLDCSALVQHVYKQQGVNLPRTSYEQSKVGTKVSWNNLQPGDLIYFDTIKNNGKNVDHVGIYAGNGKMIHASSGSGKVVEVNLNTSYWKNNFTVARRVSGSGGSSSSSSSSSKTGTVAGGAKVGGSATSGSVGKNITSTRTEIIQHALNVWGGYKPNGNRIATDGSFGPQTTAAVKAFQRANNLTPDGIVGPATLAALKKKGYL
jgi:murein DD-endopeptidase / murein LD-carboxypeptidase